MFGVETLERYLHNELSLLWSLAALVGAFGILAVALAAIGPLRALVPRAKSLRGGMTFRGYHAVFAKGSAEVSTYFTADGKVEQLLIQQIGD